MKRVFNMLMDQAGAEGAGSGGAGGEGNPGAEGAGAGDDTAGQNTGSQGNAGTGEEQFDLTVGGKVIKLNKTEVINRAQQATDITQKQQKISETQKTLNTKVRQADMLLKEIEDQKATGQSADPADEDKFKKLTDEISSLQDVNQQRELDNALAPAKAKYPHLNEDMIINAFTQKANAGEIENSAAGIMEVAAELATTENGSFEQRVNELIKDPNNPQMKKYNDKLIADYVAGKRRSYNNGGEHGGAGGTGGGNKPIEDIADAAKMAKANRAS